MGFEDKRITLVARKGSGTLLRWNSVIWCSLAVLLLIAAAGAIGLSGWEPGSRLAGSTIWCGVLILSISLPILLAIPSYALIKRMLPKVRVSFGEGVFRLEGPGLRPVEWPAGGLHLGWRCDPSLGKRAICYLYISKRGSGRVICLYGSVDRRAAEAVALPRRELRAGKTLKMEVDPPRERLIEMAEALSRGYREGMD